MVLNGCRILTINNGLVSPGCSNPFGEPCAEAMVFGLCPNHFGMEKHGDRWTECNHVQPRTWIGDKLIKW